MAAAEDAHLISAAVTIRQELDTLVPADAEAVGAKLDADLIRVEIVPIGERPEVVEGIFNLLKERPATRRRLGELLPGAAAERGISEAFLVGDQALAGPWAGYQTLAGPPADDDEIVKIICLTCKFVNKLAARPPADDPGNCRNPEPPEHVLKMA